DATIDKNQICQTFLLFLQAAVAARDDLRHAGKIIVLASALSEATGLVTANNKFSVVGLFHLAVFPNDHGRDSVSALDMGDVETFNTLGDFRKIESVLERFGNGFRRRLHDAEALIERVLGVAFHQVKKRTFAAALRGEDFKPVAGFL